MHAIFYYNENDFSWKEKKPCMTIWNSDSDYLLYAVEKKMFVINFIINFLNLFLIKK